MEPTARRALALNLEGATQYVAMDVGDAHGCVVRADGQLYCWGQNDELQAQPGIWTAPPQIDPTPPFANVTNLLNAQPVMFQPTVLTTETRAVEVAAGGRFTCARLSNGTVQCWGRNDQRQASPAAVDRVARATMRVLDDGSTRRARSIAAGAEHACAVVDDGRVFCWGRNDQNQLGRPAYVPARTISTVEVSGSGQSQGVALTNAVKVTAGDHHACALTSGGDVWCWGDWRGDSTVTRDADPVNLNGAAGTIVDISAGGGHTCARTATGGVLCWGRNDRGQLGDGTTESDEVAQWVDLPDELPQQVRGLGVGKNHSCVILADSRSICWGAGLKGELGTGTNADAHAPTAVVTNVSEVVRIAGGDKFTCAIAHTTNGADGTVFCWGQNDVGQIPNGSVGTNSPTAVFSFTPDFQCSATQAVFSAFHNGPLVETGEAHTCAVVDMPNCWHASTLGWFWRERGVVCWGANQSGQLGRGTTSESEFADNVSDIAGDVIDLALGRRHSCALMSNGTVRCWGANNKGQLGIGSTSNQTTPQSVSLGGLATAIVAGGDTTCALLANSLVQCWGSDENGQLGNNTPGIYGASGYSTVPVTVCAQNLSGDPWDDLSTAGCNLVNVVQLTASDKHVCARISNGTVRCWGHNHGTVFSGSNSTGGILGTMSGLSSDESALPFAGEALPWARTTADERAMAISAHEAGNCLVRANGSVWCWGGNDHHRRGTSGAPTNDAPNQVSLSIGAVSLHGSFQTKCALLGTGGVTCWGNSLYGQAGDNGNTAAAPTVVQINSSTGLGDVIRVVSGTDQSCAMVANGNVWCWGRNNVRNLGQAGASDPPTSSQALLFDFPLY